MNESRTNPSKTAPAPLPVVKQEQPVKRPVVPGAFSLPKDVEEQVISYLEQKSAAKNDYDKALDFFLDLNSDFGVEDDRK